MLRKPKIAVVVLGMSLLGFAGCSGTGAAFTGAQIGLNLAKKTSWMKVWLDGQQAKQNTLKKAATGYSNWDVKDQVATGPKLRFEIEDASKFGRITMVSVSIFQKFQADYSHQAEYTIVSRSNEPMEQMKPDTEYDLANPGPEFRVLDLTGKEVSGVNLTPGMQYMLTLTVKADHSETAQVYFSTK